MFLGMEAIMKITLYTNPFYHAGIKNVGVMVMVRSSSGEIVGCFSSTTYATPDDWFSCAHQIVSTTGSLQKMLESLGHTVEVEDVLKSIEALSARLRDEVLA